MNVCICIHNLNIAQCFCYWMKSTETKVVFIELKIKCIDIENHGIYMFGEVYGRKLFFFIQPNAIYLNSCNFTVTYYPFHIEKSLFIRFMYFDIKSSRNQKYIIYNNKYTHSTIIYYTEVYFCSLFSIQHSTYV